MPWEARSVMDQRVEFVMLASAPGANVSGLCRRFGISRQAGYKWLGRFRAAGGDAAALAQLADRSRRPRSSPLRTCASLEQRVVSVRLAHPAWGGRKIRAVLEREGVGDAGVGGGRGVGGLGGVPSASTITQILRRRGLLEEGPGQGRGPCTRFEDPAPNGTWQMDFKGHVPLSRGGRCHPLTVTDDHSRYCISLRSCLDEREATVRGELERAFGRYGLPGRILCDNGSPWGSGASREWTALEVWLLERGVRTTHGRVYHPQTQGKQERFHRTLKAEVLRRVELADAQEAQRLFDAWRTQYNTLRPHEALQMDTPSQRYRPSEREYTGRALDLGYEPGEELRKADEHGRVRYRGVQWRVGRAFAGRTLAVREDPWGREGIKSVCFGPYEVASLDVRAGVGVGLQGECERPRRGRRLAPLAAARDAE